MRANGGIIRKAGRFCQAPLAAGPAPQYVSAMDFAAHWHDSISELGQSEWDALLPSDASPGHSWAWLRAMEASGSVAPASGWQPSHLVLRDKAGRAAAAAALYFKDHSHGEYIYDYQWADIAAQLGVDYYPKLVACIPATPSPDYRFLIPDGADAAVLADRLLRHIEERAASVNSLHFVFVHPQLAGLLARRGYQSWRHQRFAWRNRGYAAFDDFAARFGKNQRRNIRREREEAQGHGLALDIVGAGALGPADRERHARLMWRFYRDTNEQFGPWAAFYLNEEFFLRAVELCGDDLLFGRAWRPGEAEPRAMTLMVRRGGQLYGRFWGAAGFYSSLHFELCYYLPIEYCIREGIALFDPGAGSPHKIRRGFDSEASDSYHRFGDRRLNELFAAWMPAVNQHEDEQIRLQQAESPLR